MLEMSSHLHAPEDVSLEKEEVGWITEPVWTQQQTNKTNSMV
jgi:hypothetical protein